MAKPQRSPLLGYNHNVKYKGRVYHVQTEDSGPQNPHLFTHLYYEGTILATKRHEYDGEAPEEVVKGLMQGQHKAILKELLQNRFDDKLSAFFDSRGEPVLGEAPAVPAAAILDGPTEPTPAPVAPAITADGMLDLDALPTGGTGESPPPEPAPPDIVVPSGPGGPGIYSMKKPARPERMAPASAQRPSQILPVVVFEDPSKPPPLPAGRVSPTPAAPVPGPRPTPPPAVARATPSAGHPTHPTPSPDGSVVVVQRQVVVGVGGNRPPAVNRPRRPAPPIPYVVKEGSHPMANRPTGSRPPLAPAARPAAPQPPPPRPLVPPPTTSANAPRTAAPPPGGRPTGELISDKSLDEVILAYLSQGEGER